MNRRATLTRSTLALDEEQTIDYCCLFITKLQLQTNELSYVPGLGQFQKVLSDTMTRFQDCTLAVPNLLPDPLFNAFTRYYIELI